jgi:hypothetical protein
MQVIRNDGKSTLMPYTKTDFNRALNDPSIKKVSVHKTGSVVKIGRMRLKVLPGGGLKQV